MNDRAEVSPQNVIIVNTPDDAVCLRDLPVLAVQLPRVPIQKKALAACRVVFNQSLPQVRIMLAHHDVQRGLSRLCCQ
jgi:hypothetical protein